MKGCSAANRCLLPLAPNEAYLRARRLAIDRQTRSKICMPACRCPCEPIINSEGGILIPRQGVIVVADCPFKLVAWIQFHSNFRLYTNSSPN